MTRGSPLAWHSRSGGRALPSGWVGCKRPFGVEVGGLLEAALNELHVGGQSGNVWSLRTDEDRHLGRMPRGLGDDSELLRPSQLGDVWSRVCKPPSPLMNKNLWQAVRRRKWNRSSSIGHETKARS